MIDLNDFRNYILDKIITLQKMESLGEDDKRVIQSQAVGYNTILQEIDMYIEGLADDEIDIIYNTIDPDENI